MADPLEILKKQVQTRNMHPPAGSAPPVVLRALDAVRKIAPHKAVGVIPKEMDWDDPYAFSNHLGYNELGDKQNVHINPAVAMLYSQGANNNIMAHEVEHVWQNRNADPQEAAIGVLENNFIPYNERPREKAAFKAQEGYGFSEDPPAAGWLRQFLPTMQGLFRSGRGK